MFTTVRASGMDLVEGDPEPSADFLWQLTAEAAAGDSESEAAGLPAGLDWWLPSPYLAAVVSAVEAGSLSGHDRIDLLKAEQRLASHFQARVLKTMVSVHETMTELENGDTEFGFRMASTEIRAALQQTARAANSELSMALDLSNDTYSEVREALVQGLLGRRRAGLIVHRTSHLEPETAKRVVTEVMKEAVGMTSGEIIARIDQLNIATNPDQAQSRYEQGLADRRVYPEKNWDGTSHYMGLHLPRNG